MTDNRLAMEDAMFKAMADVFNAKDPKELDNEGVISLVEEILKGIRIDMKHVIAAYRISPKSPEVLNSVKNMDDLLRSNYFNILTMGHGATLSQYFREKVHIEDDNGVKKIG